MQFAESFEHDADDVMDEIVASAEVSPTLTPIIGLGSEDPAAVKDLFQSFDTGAPSVEKMKRIGLHHDEAFEL